MLGTTILKGPSYAVPRGRLQLDQQIDFEVSAATGGAPGWVPVPAKMVH